MSNEQKTKYYVSSGPSRLIVLAKAPAIAACDLILRVMRDGFKAQFGPKVYVHQQGFRDEDNADDAAQFETYLIFLCGGIISSMTSRETFETFFFTQGGQTYGNQDDDE